MSELPSMFYIFFGFSGRSILNKDQYFLSTSLKTGHMSTNIVGTSTDFTFIDLFAGIGGIRIALEKNGGKCVFSSEWNKYSRKTYEHNFGDSPAGDITKINAADIPDHAVLAAGFPCQPFSIAGISKKKSLNRETLQLKLHDQEYQLH